MSTATAELKAFETLEAKIKRTVELVSKLKAENAEIRGKFDSLEEANRALAETNERLRSEKSDLEMQLATLKSSLDEGSHEARKELESMKLSQQTLTAELSSLKEERELVLSRVDGLLADLDRIALD